MRCKTAQVMNSTNARLYDGSLTNGYLEANSVIGLDGSYAGGYLSHSVLPPYRHGKLDQRASDDSIRLLLANRSLNFTNEPLSIGNKLINPEETYDEIPNKLLNDKNDLTTENQNQLSKVNEYCYIQANGLITGTSERNDQVGCSNNQIVVEFDSKTTPSSSKIHSPQMITSTPSAPKSLPPSKNNIQKMKLKMSILAMRLSKDQLNQLLIFTEFVLMRLILRSKIQT